MEHNLRYWIKTDIDQIVVLDYGCEDLTAFRASKEFKDEKKLDIVRVDPQQAGPFFDYGRAINIAFRAAKHGTLFITPDNVRFSAFTYQEMVEEFEEKNYEVAVNNSYVLDYSLYSDYANVRQDDVLFTNQAYFALVGGFYEHQGIHSNLGTMNLWGNHIPDYIARCDAFSPPNVGVFETTSDVICRKKDLEEQIKYQPIQKIIKTMPNKIHELSAEYLLNRLNITYKSSVLRGFGINEPTNEVYYVRNGQKFTFNWSF